MKLLLEQTIVGISTAISRAAISIVRLSGEDAINIVNSVFLEKDLTKAKSHTIHYGHIIDYKTKEIIDEVLVSIFRAPKTYTKEDVVEINCHGGGLVTQLILDQMILLGARLATEGEFTKRAYLNGRIDLTKAEAVMDVIDAESKSALSVANQGLNGKTKQKIEDLRQKLLNVIMRIYVNIDYPEYDDVKELTNNEVKPIVLDVLEEIEKLLLDSKDAVNIKNGINTVIIGKPNVGKSSILNALLNEDKAIVTPIPGTTRDTIEAKLNIGQYILNLIDTAGIHNTEDFVEQIGVQKSVEKIEKADLVLMVFDGSRSFSKEDLDLMNKIQDKKHIYIVNKQDLKQEIDLTKIDNPVLISTMDQSINRLEQEIEKVIFNEKIEFNKNIYITNSRQIEKLSDAKQDLEKALIDINDEQFIDLIQISINEAWEALSEILGEVKDTEIIDNLFKNFCLGK